MGDVARSITREPRDGETQRAETRLSFYSPDVKRPGINNRRIRGKKSRKVRPRRALFSPLSFIVSPFSTSVCFRGSRVHVEENVDTIVRSKQLSLSRESSNGTSHPAQARIQFPLIYQARLDFCASNNLSYRIFPYFNRRICARLINCRVWFPEFRFHRRYGNNSSNGDLSWSLSVGRIADYHLPSALRARKTKSR